MTDPLLTHRDRFPILEKTNYLISNSLGAAPRDVRDSLIDYYETWADRGVRAWEEGWWRLSETVGDLVAPLIGAWPGEVVFQPNVTLAHAVIFSAFDFRQGRPKVVTDAMHFPSILYLLDGLRDSGAELEVISSDDGITVETGRLIEAIDERTAFVNVSHVFFKSSYIQEIEALAARASEVGAATIIDGYQAVGSMPVDVRALGVDVYLGGCLKWLCGGPGAAFLWVKPEWRSALTPQLTGWMSHRRPFAFEPRLDRRDDSWRFLHGTPNVAALYAARPGLELIGAIGLEAIRVKSERQIRRLVDLAASRGYPCTTPLDPARRGGTVAIDVPHGLAVSRALKAQRILCDYRSGAGIRLAPHFYTRDDELDEAIDAIAEILDRDGWATFEADSSPIT